MLGSVLDIVIPDGPLHPRDAAWAMAAGILVGLLAGRRSSAWLALAPLATLTVTWVRYDDLLWRGVVDHADRTLAIALIIGCLALPAIRPVPVRPAIVATLGFAAGVWAIVPDTEVPLMTGAVLVGAGVLLPRPSASRLTGVIVVLPIIAAVVGSVGRPERLGLGLGVGLVAAVGLATLWSIVSHGVRRIQRAGTPTTVEAAATSSTTTAPAPTIAP